MPRVRIIGRPSVEPDDGPGVWPAGRRAGELLAFLAAHPGMHPRGDVAARFWPDVLDASARASLRTALHELRRDLGPAGRIVVARRDAVGLRDDVVVDLRQVRAAAADGRDAEALAAAGDSEPLVGIDAEWAHAVRDAHRDLLGGVLARAAARALAGGDAAEAIRLARRRAALDPLAEEPVRELMRLLAAHGDRAAAIAAYTGLRERMARELRAAPSPATRDLAAELRAAPSGPEPAPPGGSRRLADRIAEGARRSFVGRAAERAELGAMIAARRVPTPVVFVTGPGGVGKTRLLDVVLADAAPDVRVLRIDCRDVEPTPVAFLAALAAAAGADARTPTPELLADVLDADGRRTVLCLDSHESFRLADAWLRRTFLPLMPEQVLTVIAGRHPPSSPWLTSPGWSGLVRVLPLADLDEEDALALLAARGLDAGAARHANAFARGHPLALELAAAAARDRPGLRLDAGPPDAVVARLVDAYSDGLDPATVDALRAASVLRRVDESLLRVLLGPERGPAAYEELRGQPFCEETADGLVLHRVVRDVLARDLARRDPARAARLRRAAARAIDSPGAAGGWRRTADLLHLVANPAVREAFVPGGEAPPGVEPAGRADGEAVLAISARWNGPEEDAAVRAWWRALPDAFGVVRGPDGAVAGFGVVAEHAMLDPALRAADPVAARWQQEIVADPVGSGERVLLIRTLRTARGGGAPSPELAALFLDAKRLYMEMRPHLRRVYTVAPPGDLPGLAPIGFAPAGPPLVRDGSPLHPLVLDFGPGSVDGWLATLIDAEARVDLGADAALTPG